MVDAGDPNGANCYGNRFMSQIDENPPFVALAFQSDWNIQTPI